MHFTTCASYEYVPHYRREEYKYRDTTSEAARFRKDRCPFRAILQTCAFYEAFAKVYIHTSDSARSSFKISNSHSHLRARSILRPGRDSDPRKIRKRVPAECWYQGRGGWRQPRGCINEERLRGEAEEFSGLTFPWARSDTEVGCNRDTAGQQMELVCAARLCTDEHTRARWISLRENGTTFLDSCTHVQRRRRQQIFCRRRPVRILISVSLRSIEKRAE